MTMLAYTGNDRFTTNRAPPASGANIPPLYYQGQRNRKIDRIIYTRDRADAVPQAVPRTGNWLVKCMLAPRVEVRPLVANISGVILVIYSTRNLRMHSRTELTRTTQPT